MGPETGPPPPRTIKGRWLAIGLVVFILVVAGLGYWILFSNYKGSMFHF
jgi:hypothetical protein